ncbi:MAG: PspA/IM30 family protein [Kofleriaceae bacterium]|nr:PspA/IM30 family protein [Myxococcales bacterium]MCB9562686.1 PspA/IM30 family protein [Kofleriaceae bacterium]MCB9571005.1 PspA/IM30 family protein [Kofleriaceae bacterium]
MGLFRRMKDGIKSRANAAIDKAIDPEKELDIAIMELEEGRKKALQELISYKATAKTMEEELQKYQARADGWEKKAMIAVRAGDDEAARTALREKKNAQVEVEKITRDRDEAASYAIQLNKSRKEFETKLQILKMRKGTLATQLAAARSASGDAFGGTSGELFDKFQQAEDRIDAEAIETEVDAALRGEELAAADFDAKLLAAGGDPRGTGTEGDPDAALAAIKAKVEAQKAARQARIAEAQAKALPAAKKDGDAS